MLLSLTPFHSFKNCSQHETKLIVNYEEEEKQKRNDPETSFLPLTTDPRTSLEHSGALHVPAGVLDSDADSVEWPESSGKLPAFCPGSKGHRRQTFLWAARTVACFCCCLCIINAYVPGSCLLAYILLQTHFFYEKIVLYTQF